MVEGQESSAKHIADIVGEWGNWQFRLSSFALILSAANAMNNMGYSFHAFDNDFWCSDVPMDYPNKTELMKCNRYLNPNESCSEWHYDRTEFHTSITTQFDLVCERSNYASLSQSAYMLGYVVSGLVFSHYSDKYGRRPITWISFIIEIIGVLSCALSGNIYFYSFSRFLMGMGSSGKMTAIDALLLECCGPKHRSDIMLLVGLGWILGYALVPVLAYWLQNYQYMLFSSLLPMLSMMVWFYFLYESPRWQMANGQVDRAEVTLGKALICNRKPVENLKEQLNELSEHLKIVQSEDQSKKVYNLWDLVRTPNLRKITSINCFNWIVNSLIYYGFSFNMSDFGGNFYITFLLSGLVELPSQLVTVLLLRFIGRRKLFALFMTLTAVSSFAVIPSRSNWLKVMFALVGKFGATSASNVRFIHVLELYPTVIRHSGIGFCSVVGRIGSISAPFMKNLAANTSLTLVMVLYGTLTSMTALLGLLLPETKGREIPDTIEEAENTSLIEMKAMKPKDND